MEQLKLGNVALVPRGDWSKDISYDRLNVVLYKGSSYVALQDNKNKEPNGSDGYWHILAEHGASAYDVAVINGYTGTAAEWLESLHNGAQGPKGDKGDKGDFGSIVVSGTTMYFDGVSPEVSDETLILIY